MTQRASQPLGPDDLVFCDFDGTISVVDTGIAIIDALDLQEAWEVEHIWRRGEISSMECLARQFALVNLPENEFLALVDSFAMHEDFREFVGFVQDRGASIVVVSDGLDIYLDRMLGRLGFTVCDGEQVLERRHDCLPRFANHAEMTPGGIRIDFPHRTPVCAQCGNCKLEHLFRLRPHFGRVIYAGDGHSDMCPARYADVLFARSHLARDAAQSGLSFWPFENFGDIMRVLE